MATLVKLPQFGVTMLEATVVAWLKAVGDHVERGDAVATIETDKLSQEVTANATGTLRRIVAQVGETIKVMQAMAVIGAPGEPESAIDEAIGGGPPRPVDVAAPRPRPQRWPRPQRQPWRVKFARRRSLGALPVS